MDIPRVTDAPPAAVGLPPLLAQDEFGAAPGGRPVGFPPGIEREVFRGITPGASEMSREDFDRRYPAPSFGPAIRDVQDALTGIYRGVVGPSAGATVAPDGTLGGAVEQPPAADAPPPVKQLITILLDP